MGLWAFLKNWYNELFGKDIPEPIWSSVEINKYNSQLSSFEVPYRIGFCFRVNILEIKYKYFDFLTRNDKTEVFQFPKVQIFASKRWHFVKKLEIVLSEDNQMEQILRSVNFAITSMKCKTKSKLRQALYSVAYASLRDNVDLLRKMLENS